MYRLPSSEWFQFISCGALRRDATRAAVASTWRAETVGRRRGRGVPDGRRARDVIEAVGR